MGGTRILYTRIEHDAPASASRLNYICVDDPEGLDRILSLTYLENYVKVIRRASEKSGHSLKDIDFLFTNQVKRSLSRDIFQSVGLGGENTVTSIRDFGHMGTVDNESTKPKLQKNCARSGAKAQILTNLLLGAPQGHFQAEGSRSKGTPSFSAGS